MKTKKILSVFIAIISVAIALDLWFGYENKTIVTTVIQVEDEDIPSSFSSFRIVQVSDLHNATFGYENKNLINALEKAEPDIIVLTGDMVDISRPDIDVTLKFAEKASQIAPTYFVTGNHDVKVVGREKLLAGLSEKGVTVLRNEKVVIEKNGEKITLIGIDDPKFLDDFMPYDDKTNTEKAIESLIGEDDGFTVLLAHRAEMIDVFAKTDVDLVLTGHAHGGQIRLPSKGGILSPGQGWWPEYTSGLYKEKNTQMIVSRGLGNSTFPFRINNKPEIVVAELICK
ncbi:MAG: metallophosphoesterase [Ruminococcaceae bacterium]|nr:metallophosphoesterase [Oscillospiraceae bacterium]